MRILRHHRNGRYRSGAVIGDRFLRRALSRPVATAYDQESNDG